MDAEKDIDLRAVRAALRACLEAAGLEVASDTLGMRSELYVVGDDDLARALFEFARSSADAVDAMYQGSWVEGLPPRFAVLPAEEAESPSAEMLEQIRVIPLYFSSHEVGIEFHDLGTLLEANGVR